MDTHSDTEQAWAEQNAHLDGLDLTHNAIRTLRRACICDGYEGLACDVAGEDCALRESDAGQR